MRPGGLTSVIWPVYGFVQIDMAVENLKTFLKMVHIEFRAGLWKRFFWGIRPITVFLHLKLLEFDYGPENMVEYGMQIQI